MQYPKVILPRRFKADTADSVIATGIMLVPLFTLYPFAQSWPAVLQPLPLVGFPAGVLYVVFSDAVAKGTSLGKRWVGLQVIDLRSGAPCAARRVWARNLLDPIPILDVIDCALMCLDRRGQKLMDNVLGTQVIER
jgi:uncharacterized RDD family membrane protein YckC